MAYHIPPSRIALILISFILFSARSFSQSNPLDKKLEKAQELLNENKVDDAETYVLKLLGENPGYGDGWDLLAGIRYRQYLKAKSSNNGLSANFTITTKDENGQETKVKNDSLAQQLNDLLGQISLPKIAYSKYTYTLRKATLETREAWRCSTYLRILFVDVNVDSNISKKALKYFNEAETEFEEKNYDKAATLYQRAADEQPDFYKAQMYLGDCYYATKNYSDAVKSFSAAKQRFPYLLEPSKYLTDAYSKLGLYEKSEEEAIRSTTIYPDYAMLQKLEDVASFSHMKVNISWTKRGVFPNKVTDTTKKDINEYNAPDVSVSASPWKFYTGAFEKIRPYCDSKGIVIKPNPLTKSKYMEVYSWEELLKNSDDPSLAEARQMQKAGYLDCYAMVTCFHHDLYDQYLDFIEHNRNKVAAYFKAFTKPM
jgi:tetratricopeptide (TPR) repeat protein